MPEKSGVHVTAADSGWPVAATAEPDPKKDGTGADPHSKAKRVAAGVVETDERQKLVVNATGGNFKLVFSGQTTADIAFNASPAAIVTALEALSNIAVGEVAVSGGVGGAGGNNPYYITFQNALGEQDVAQITSAAGTAPLTGAPATATVTTVTPGA